MITNSATEYLLKKKDEIKEEIAINRAMPITEHYTKKEVSIQDYKTALLRTYRTLPMIIAFVVLLIVGVPFREIIVYLILGGILLTILCHVYLFFLRRKHSHDQNIRKSNLSKIQTQLDQLQNEEIVKTIKEIEEKE